MHQRIVRMVATLSALVVSCSDKGSSLSQQAQELFENPDRHLAHVGLGENLPPQAEIGVLRAARPTPNGSRIVLLDGVPPFVKVYGRDGAFITSFLEKGQGPKEDIGPRALAVNDSTILVVGLDGGLELFRFDGSMVTSSPPLPLNALAATALCSQDWLIYGPRIARDLKGTWLHHIAMESSGLALRQSFMPDFISSTLPIGKPYGVVADDDSVFVWHELTDHPAIVRLSCDSKHVQSDIITAVQSRDIRGERARTRQVRSGDRFPSGLAMSQGRQIFAQLAVENDGEFTVLTLVDGDRTRKVVIPGIYSLQDSRPRIGILVETSTPVPQVFLLSFADLDKIFQN